MTKVKGLTPLTIILVTVFFSGWVNATPFKTYLRNREGVREFKKKSYYGANQKFMKALEDDPLNAEVQMNLARTFEAEEDFVKAEQAYKGALKVIPEKSPLKFEALFNLAGTQAKLKRIDDALATYQAALALEPDSLEVKNNIELLWQGGGGGGGDDKDKKQEGEGGGQPQQQPDQGQDQNQKQKPKPFNSEDLSPEDVKRILDEIKNQEQNIRAQDYDKGAKDAPKAKDW